MVRPRPPLRHRNSSTEWGNPVLLPRLVAVGDVEPPPPPVLRGLELLQVEVLGVPTGLDAETPNGVHAASAGIALHVDDPLPQPPVRVNAEETLAQDDEAADVEDILRAVL